MLLYLLYVGLLFRFFEQRNQKRFCHDPNFLYFFRSFVIPKFSLCFPKLCDGHPLDVTGPSGVRTAADGGRRKNPEKIAEIRVPSPKFRVLSRRVLGVRRCSSSVSVCSLQTCSCCSCCSNQNTIPIPQFVCFAKQAEPSSLRRMRICVLLLLLCALPLCAVTAAPEWDLSWVAGIEYTPSLAPGNSLWWWRWGEFAPQVDRELSLASQLFGFNFLRMFLHPMVFDGDTGRDNGTALFQAMDSFLAIATKYGMKSSFAFFDDCWNHAGASLTSPCTPIKGRHNGCWMAAPQDKDRTSVDRFRPYVYDTVRRFANDDRIALWEIFNEPNVQDTFSITLRSSAFGWALAALKDGTSGDGQGQRVPVLSCWDDNNSTQVSDMHRYDTFFPKWTQQVFQSPGKGALITEGGSRWFQGYDSDSGSPLTVLHWFHHLRSITPSAAAPFKFGMVTNWELMVVLFFFFVFFFCFVVVSHCIALIVRMLSECIHV